MKVRTNRGIWAPILLSPLTLGIYPIVWWCYLVKDINTSCKSDGKHTMNYIGAFLLGMITFGIYFLIWQINFVIRVYNNTERLGAKPKGSLAKYFIFTYLLGGFIVFGLIAYSDLVKTSNRLGKAYNERLKDN